MLYINDETTWTTWWVGQEIPKFEGSTRVVNFQADGHELQMILDAMVATRPLKIAASPMSIIQEMQDEEEPRHVR